MEILGLFIILAIGCWGLEDLLFSKRVPYPYRHPKGRCGGHCEACDPD